MILGTGIDLVEVARLESSYARFGERLLERLLRPAERAYCLSHKTPGPYLAARFAAKEAIAKAFGTGLGARMGWQDLEVGRRLSGEPFVILHGGALALFQERGGRVVHLSLTHTPTHAMAMAILES